CPGRDRSPWESLGPVRPTTWLGHAICLVWALLVQYTVLVSSTERAYGRGLVYVTRWSMAACVAFQKESHYGLGTKSCPSSVVNDRTACAARRFERERQPSPRAGVCH